MKLSVDGTLAEEVRRLGRHKTKTAAVNAALYEYVRRHK